MFGELASGLTIRIVPDPVRTGTEITGIIKTHNGFYRKLCEFSEKTTAISVILV